MREGRRIQAQGEGRGAAGGGRTEEPVAAHGDRAGGRRQARIIARHRQLQAHRQAIGDDVFDQQALAAQLGPARHRQGHAPAPGHRRIGQVEVEAGAAVAVKPRIDAAVEVAVRTPRLPAHREGLGHRAVSGADDGAPVRRLAGAHQAAVGMHEGLLPRPRPPAGVGVGIAQPLAAQVEPGQPIAQVAQQHRRRVVGIGARRQAGQPVRIGERLFQRLLLGTVQADACARHRLAGRQAGRPHRHPVGPAARRQREVGERYDAVIAAQPAVVAGDRVAALGRDLQAVDAVGGAAAEQLVEVDAQGGGAVGGRLGLQHTVGHRLGEVAEPARGAPGDEVAVVELPGAHADLAQVHRLDRDAAVALRAEVAASGGKAARRILVGDGGVDRLALGGHGVAHAWREIAAQRDAVARLGWIAVAQAQRQDGRDGKAGQQGLRTDGAVEGQHQLPARLRPLVGTEPGAGAAQRPGDGDLDRRRFFQAERPGGAGETLRHGQGQHHIARLGQRCGTQAHLRRGRVAGRLDRHGRAVGVRQLHRPRRLLRDHRLVEGQLDEFAAVVAAVDRGGVAQTQWLGVEAQRSAGGQAGAIRRGQAFAVEGQGVARGRGERRRGAEHGGALVVPAPASGDGRSEGTGGRLANLDHGAIEVQAQLGSGVAGGGRDLAIFADLG